jgi:hypothetical protein
MGASFGVVGAGSTFSASPLAAADVGRLLGTAGVEGSVLWAWDISTNVSGEVLLSGNVGTGWEGLKVWELEGAAWTQYMPAMLTHSADGMVSFTADRFSGFAVTGVPEPGVMGVVAGASLMMLGRRRRGRSPSQ